MTGCSGCFNYTRTEGRDQRIVVDPTTTTNGSIVAYAASVGGGVWKTTNCCTRLDDVDRHDRRPADLVDEHRHARDRPERPQHDLRRHRRPQLRLVLDGQPGRPQVDRRRRRLDRARRRRVRPGLQRAGGAVPAVRRRRQGRASTRTTATTSSPARRRASSSRTTAASNWTGPCTHELRSPTQRQDITALELTNLGGGARGSSRPSARAASRRPCSTTSARTAPTASTAATMPASGCPAFTSIATNANGFVFGTAVTGSPYATGANLNAGSGSPYVSDDERRTSSAASTSPSRRATRT